VKPIGSPDALETTESEVAVGGTISVTLLASIVPSGSVSLDKILTTTGSPGVFVTLVSSIDIGSRSAEQSVVAVGVTVTLAER